MMKKLSLILLTISLAFTFSACGNKREADLIIEDAINAYSDAVCQDENVEGYMAELAEVDEDKAELWQDIFDYWDYANNELVVNEGMLPDDLPKDDSLAIVILGFELNDDGTMQEELIGRLNVALNCAKQYPNAFVVCTGGGTAKNNKNVTEANLMAKWLIENGLDENRIIIENKSMTTLENARFTYKILLEDYPQVNRIALVTSSYHIPWGSLIFEATILKSAAESNTPMIHIVSNAAYNTVNEKYKDVLKFETMQLTQLIEY